MLQKHTLEVYVSFAVVTAVAGAFAPWLVLLSIAALAASVVVAVQKTRGDQTVQEKVASLEAEIKVQQASVKKIEGDVQSAINRVNMTIGVRK